MCWANQRLVAPANSASQHTSSISVVDENPSKNTPTGINHSLTNSRHAAAGGGASSLQPAARRGLPVAPADCAEPHPRKRPPHVHTIVMGQIALDQFATLLSTWIVKPGSCKVIEGRLCGHKQDATGIVIHDRES